jgi:hypothetical protein
VWPRAVRRLLGRIRRWQADRRQPAAVERRRDRRGVPSSDPGIERAVDEGIGWLGRAQDESASRDGGVAAWFSLSSGWSTSYPETTGYIVPTMLAYARLRGAPEARERARRMLDWLVSIQLPEGGFQGGLIGGDPRPVTFNAGQILIGLAVGARELGDERYWTAARAAADWLVRTQEADGCWRRHSSPLVAPGDKVYDTHVGWGLLEAARLDSGRGYSESAIANVRWALSWQRGDNGWLERCCLDDPERPLTHTLGYALRGVLEAYRYTGDASLLEASVRTAEPLLAALGGNGFLPGRLDRDWRPAAPWACLTGTAQVSICWLLLHRFGAGERFLAGARRANRYVRRTMSIAGPPSTRGGVKGSFPIDGGYHPFQFTNWACKFAVDASMLEREALGSGSP